MIASVLSLQFLMYALAVGAAVVIFLHGLGVARRARIVVAGVLPAAAVVSAVGWTVVTHDRTASRSELLAAAPDIGHRQEGFVSSQSCRACHPGEYEAWHDSYHRTMTQPATP